MLLEWYNAREIVLFSHEIWYYDIMYAKRSNDTEKDFIDRMAAVCYGRYINA